MVSLEPGGWKATEVDTAEMKWNLAFLYPASGLSLVHSDNQDTVYICYANARLTLKLGSSRVRSNFNQDAAKKKFLTARLIHSAENR